MPDLTAEDEAAAMVAAVRDDPARRLELAARFYDRRAGRPSIRSYRRAELAFMRTGIRSTGSLCRRFSTPRIPGPPNRLRRDPAPAHALYAHAASELSEPRLLEMLRDGAAAGR